MPKFTVAIIGGGIAGLCLATVLLKHGDIRVDVYEASSKFEEVGAGLTLWGRVCEALRLMDLADDCMKAAVIAASTSGLPTTTGFTLRGFKQPDVDFGGLPIRDAWSLHRSDLLQILLKGVPSANTHLGKKLKRYVQDDVAQVMRLEFSDGTSATCDVVVGCDGIRSNTRAQMMRDEAAITGRNDHLRCIDPRWSGTTAYRVLTPASRLAARNPNHSMLSGGQVYFGKSSHVVGYPISRATLNIAVNVTDPAKEGTRWPSSSWSRIVDRTQFARDVAPIFADWDPEVRDIMETAHSAIEWAIHDVEPLPFYAKGRVVLVGDSAHAAVPYIGTGAAFALEDAYILSHILRADATTCATLPLALEAYQAVRRPYGNKLVLNARLALREFQYNGPEGGDMARVKETIHGIFEESARVGGSGPQADGQKAVAWLENRLARR